MCTDSPRCARWSRARSCPPRRRPRRWRARCLHRHPARRMWRGRHADHRRGPRERGVRTVAVVAQLCRAPLPRLPPAPDDRHRPLPDAVRGPAGRAVAAVRRRAVLGRAGRRHRRASPGGGVRGAPGARGGRHRGACRGRATSTPARAGWISRPSSGTWPAGSRRPVGGCSPAWARPGPSSTAAGCGAPGSRTGRGSTPMRSSWPPAPRSRTCSASWACRSTRSTRPPPSSAHDRSTSASAWWSTRRACRCGRPPTAASSSAPGGWTPSSPTTPAPCPRSASPSCSPRRRRCSPAIPRSSRTPCTPGRARCRSTTSRCWAGSPGSRACTSRSPTAGRRSA